MLSSMLCRNLLELCVPGCVVFPADIRVVEAPHENEGLQSLGYFQMSVGGLINFLFLIRWPAVKTHRSVTCISLTLNSYP